VHLLLLTQNDVAVPRYGGALRVSALATEFCAAGHSVSVVRFRMAGEAPSSEGAPFPIHDVVMPRGYGVASMAAASHLWGRAADRIAQAIHNRMPVDLVQSDVPWAAISGVRIARKLWVPHVLLSMNCETLLARQFSTTGPARKLPVLGGLLANFNVAVVQWAEKRAIECASLTFTPSENDVEEMASVNIVPRKVEILPNGTSVRPMSREERMETKARLGLWLETPTVIFVGRMDYPPNADAIATICNVLAPRCPGVIFMLVGSNPPRIEPPSNVLMVGEVDNVDRYLGAADMAIVPLTRGSGTRIKILDAWAAGLPVLSTSIGASGLPHRDGCNILIEDDLARFPAHIMGLAGQPDLQRRLGAGGLEAAIPYRWEVIGGRYTRMLQAQAGEA
jgi:glycosyltransferase involved in cell wall biosynthesis